MNNNASALENDKTTKAENPKFPSQNIEDDGDTQESKLSPKVETTLADNCSICRNAMSEVCRECQEKQVTNKECCMLTWGTCGHVFHFHCVSYVMTFED